MAAVRGNEIVDVSLGDATSGRRTVPPEWIAASGVLA
jgi:hypothetical protein